MQHAIHWHNSSDIRWTNSDNITIITFNLIRRIVIYVFDYGRNVDRI